jgi:polysaccharide export outer membrane protein
MMTILYQQVLSRFWSKSTVTDRLCTRRVGISARAAFFVVAVAAMPLAGLASAQSGAPQTGAAPATPPARSAANAPGAVVAPTGVPTPPGYVIGPDDVLTVFFWRDKDMTGDVGVRPDGKITLPLLNDIDAVGKTPDQLRDVITKLATQSGVFTDPTVTVVVKAINSRKVSIQGKITKPKQYPLMGPTTVLELIATAGGVQEFAKSEEIQIIRKEGGRSVAHKFNYKEVSKGKKLEQNIELQPGDTIIVP